MNNNIREVREQQGIKQYALAKMTGLSEGYICHLERGTRDNPTYNVMERIAKALHKEVKDVFNI